MNIKKFLLKHHLRLILIFLFLIGIRIFLLQFPLLKNLDLEISILFSFLISILSGFGGLYFLLKGEKLSTIFFLNLIFIISLYLIFIIIELVLFNCPLTEGIFFFPLFVITSSMFSLSISSIAYSLGKIKSFVILFFIYIVLIAYSLVEYYFEPQLYLFNPLVIFFPGLVYNEIFELDGRILIYTFGLMFASGLILFPKILDESEKKILICSRNYFYILSIFTFILLFVLSDELRLSTSQEYLKSKFPLKIESEHYEIFLHDKNISEIEKQLINKKTQIHIQQLEKVFGYRTPKIKIFVINSDNSKKELLGDEVADFTKPWLRQIFVTAKTYDQTIKHELAHIFLGEETDNLFKVAAGFNLGLIEGGAMAIEWDWLENTPDYYSAMIKRFSPEIEFEKFFNNYTFATQRSSLSYLISGAFCKYLIEKYGLKKFLELYREGNFSKVYDKDLKDELNEFSAQLNSFHFSKVDSLRFKVLFGGQTLFERKCPRAINRIKFEARKLISKRSFEKAEEIYLRIFQRTSEQDAFMNLIRTKFYQKKFDEIINELNSGNYVDQFNGFNSVYIKIYYALSLAKIGNQKKAEEIIQQLKDLNISSSWNAYFDLILFFIDKPELIENIIDKNFKEMLIELKKNFPDETSILVHDIENLNDLELEKVIEAYKDEPWILKECFYRYLMLGNFTKANSLIETIKLKYSNFNEAYKYQIDLMSFVLEKLRPEKGV